MYSKYLYTLPNWGSLEKTNVCSKVRVETSQSLTDLSADAVSSFALSGLKVAE
jgi:hypothetical protein